MSSPVDEHQKPGILVPTDKYLSIATLAREIYWEDDTEVNCFLALQRFTRLSLGLIGIAQIMQGSQSRLYHEFIPQHPECQHLLIKHGFAEWIEGQA